MVILSRLETDEVNQSMFIILSQKIDTESSYSDKVFSTYHYPARYKNQIHEGDIFIYYQGNRFVKEQRYYFGTGIISKITSEDEDNYYAELHDVKRFEKTVPIYLSEGNYIEQLGFDTIRKSPTPPWQSSIRPLSTEAYQYIIANAGQLIPIQTKSIEELKDDLKRNIKAFFLENNNDAILEINKISAEIADKLIPNTDNQNE